MKRALLPLGLCLFTSFMVTASCTCGPDTATSVTVRVKNTLEDPIWVNQTSGELGVELQRGLLGSWTTFSETVPCGCRACDQVCSCSACDGGSGPLVMKLAPGSATEREWEGFIQETGSVTCGSIFDSRECFRATIPSTGETLRARLCYALGPPIGTTDPGDAGVPVRGLFDPAALLCVEGEFRPVDGVVELSPVRGESCQLHTECRQDAGELCFSGACTTGCPASGFPEYGANWQVAVSLTDQGFFTSSSAGGVTTWAGSGTLTDVQINNGTMRLNLSRPASGGGSLLGFIYLTVPPASFPVLFRNEALAVTVYDRSTSQIQNNRALVVRDSAGRLLLAADPAIPAPLLSSTDTAPFTVTGTEQIVGCDIQPCGKRLHFRTSFTSGSPSSALELDPGGSSTVLVQGLTYKVLNVVDNRPGSICSAVPQMAYLVAAQR